MVDANTETQEPVAVPLSVPEGVEEVEVPPPETGEVSPAARGEGEVAAGSGEEEGVGMAESPRYPAPEKFQPSEELQGEFWGLAKDIARQLKEEKSHFTLTPEEKDFLMLYDEHGEDLLKGFKGWAAIHWMNDRKMQLDVATAGRDLELVVQGEVSFPEGHEEVGVQELRARGPRGVVQSWRGFLRRPGAQRILEDKGGGVLGLNTEGIREVLLGEVTQKGVEVKLTDNPIDISRLSPEDIARIRYRQGSIDRGKLQADLLGAAWTRLKFLEACGADPAELTATSWEEAFSLITPPAAPGVPPAPGYLKAVSRGGLPLERSLNRALNRILEVRYPEGIPNISDAERIEIVSLAQKEATANVLGEFAVEVATIKAERFKGTGAALEERKKRLTQPDKQKQLLADMEAEETRLEGVLEKKRDVLDKTESDLDANRRELGDFTKKRGALSRTITKREGDFRKSVAALREAEKERKRKLKQYDDEIKEARGTDKTKRIEAKTQFDGDAAEEISGLIKARDERREELEAAKTQRKELDNLRDLIVYLEGRVVTLQGEVHDKVAGKKDTGLVPEIETLRSRIVEGVTDEQVQAEVDKIDMALWLRRNFGAQMAEMARPEIFLGELDELAEVSGKPEIDRKRYPGGYLNYLHRLGLHYLLFARGQTPGFEAAKALMSQKDLAKCLSVELGLGINVTRQDQLVDVFNTMRQRGISQGRLNRCFISLTEDILERGLRAGAA